MHEATFKIAKPDDVPCDLGARMTLGEWKQVAKALRTGSVNSASTEFVNVIDQLVSLAEKEYSQHGRPSTLKQAA